MKRKFLEGLTQGTMPRHHRSSDDEWDDDTEDGCQKGGGGGGQQRNAANARERARMRVLSKAFCRLKTTLPWVPADTKLSKLDTLRLATSYIAHLRAVLCLDDQPASSPLATVHPLNLTWPFSFQTPVVSPGSNGTTVGINSDCSSGNWASDQRHDRTRTEPYYERTSHDRSATATGDYCNGQRHIFRDQPITSFHANSYHDPLMQIG
ncbi:musculin [Nilaparvata lugens]|uniref:musculin n=1 Tax=Nilaparvata lugens TaxID=108931 RepID=UPI00193CD566|nr:musculin [Nilaparvata lugens]